jgi:hypothetical protein
MFDSNLVQNVFFYQTEGVLYISGATSKHVFVLITSKLLAAVWILYYHS